MPGKLSVLMVALAIGSCASSAPLRFSGENVKDEGSGLEVGRTKDPDWIAVGNSKHLFWLSLPYQVDWELKSTPNKALLASSRSADMIASITLVGKDQLKVEEQGYLQKLLKEQEGVAVRLGGRIAAVSTEKLDAHFVLEYRLELLIEGRSIQQDHFWGLRQNNAGQIYLIHLSTGFQDRVKRVESDSGSLRQKAREIVARRFDIVP